MTVEFDVNLDKDNFSLNALGKISGDGITAVFGPSGCGKTTFLRVLAGLEPDAKGRLIVDGETWMDENTCLPPHQRAIGYVFQQPGLFPHLSVENNILYGRKRRKGVSIDLDELITLLGLEELLLRQPATLSGGEQQRVAIARALASGPGMLLMDEPMASLDLKRKMEFMPYMDKLHGALSIPVIMVSHSHLEVGHLADDIVVMEQGAFVAHGKTADILTRSDLALFSQSDALCVIDATVEGHDEEHHLTRLSCSAGSLWVNQLDIQAEGRVRVQILARDVSITLLQPDKTSILNVLEGTVEEITSVENGQVMVTVRCGSDAVLSRITSRSCQLLELRQGSNVFIQVKGIAVLS